MPKGPQGQKRPADVIRNIVQVMKIATGQEAEELPKTRRAEGGKIGGKKRAEALSPKKRKEIAEKAAKARWGK